MQKEIEIKHFWDSIVSKGTPGLSYGGLAAGFIVFNYSNIFGNVLSQSGSYRRGIKITDSIHWLT